MNLGTLTAIDIFIVTTLVTIILGGVLLAYAYSASSAKKLFKSRSSKRKINIVAGSVMVTAGGALIVKA